MEEVTKTEESDDELSVKSDDRSSLKSDDSSGSNRIKYLYSYGGRILPRAADGKLRYVGGETRVMAANRNISFADLIAKMTEVLGSSAVLKCQLPGEDLDALVSIKSDEDLDNMLEEYDRLHTREASSKVRAFLFPKSASPLLSPAAAGYMAVRRVGGGGGHMDHDCERGIVHPHDATANSSNDACSTLRGGYTPPRKLHGLEKQYCLDQRGQYPRQPQIVSLPGRPPRSPVHPDGQFNSPFRYATQIHEMPPRQSSAGRSVSATYVDDGQYPRKHKFHTKYNNCSPPAQIPFNGKAPELPQEHRKKAAYQYILQNPNYGDGLQGYHAQQQFLVQH